MQRSLEVFQQEWYELSQKGKITSDTLGQIPDIYIKNEKLEESIDYLKSELDKAKLIAEKAKYNKLKIITFLINIYKKIIKTYFLF